MPKATKSELVSSELLPSTDDMNRIARQIEDFHISAKHHAETAVCEAICCGLLCLQAKQMLEHGQFKKWFAEDVPQVTYESAKRYMRIAKELKKVTVTFLEAKTPAEIANNLNDKDFKKNLLQEVNEFASGRSLTELYYDYGIVKQPKQDLFGTNNPEGVNGGKKEPLKLSEQQLELWAEDAFYGKDGFISMIEYMGKDDPMSQLYNYLPLDKLKEASEIMGNFVTHLKSVYKERYKAELKLVKGGKA